MRGLTTEAERVFEAMSCMPTAFSTAEKHYGG